MNSSSSINRYATLYEDRGLKFDVVENNLRVTIVNKTTPAAAKDSAVVELNQIGVRV